MSFVNNEETTLFAELSEQQEEIISGGSGFRGNSNFLGGRGGNNFGLSTTNFFQNASVLNTVSQSGPQGSIAGGSAIGNVIKTSGINSVGLGGNNKH